MANSKDITSASANILIVGDSGTHKTRLLGEVPGIFVFDFDKGMASNRGRSVEYATFKDAPPKWKVTKGQAAEGIFEWSKGWPAFIDSLNKIGEALDKPNCPIKAIGLDSLTFLSMMAMNNVLSVQKDPIIHQGSYGAQQEYIKLVLGQLTAWPVQLIATAHIQRNENDLTKITEKLPLLTGKLAGLIGAFFDEVYFSEADGSGYVVRTKSDNSMRQAKSRWNVPDKTPMNWAEISKHFLLPSPDKPKAPVAVKK